MKITRLRLEQVRQFRQPIELRDLDGGINLITGPNEAGKSTLVRAIRAAFFERHRSSSVSDLQPFGDSAASPSIELDFHTAGVSYQLRKSFLKRMRADLQVGTQRLANDEAEEHLAELLGFSVAGRGASKAENWGIPGLLWIDQGSGHEIHDAVGFATDHLRNALNASLGEVASTEGDDVLAQVRAERELLLTGTGRPRGVYDDVIRARAAQASAVQELRLKIDSYRDQVDRLGVVQAELADDDERRPWEAFEAQRGEAQARLDALEAAGRQLLAERDTLAQIERQRQLLADQQKVFDEQQRQLEQRSRDVDAAQARLAQADEQQAPSQRRLTGAEAAQQAAQTALTAARAAERRHALAHQLADWQPRQAALADTLRKAQALGIEVAALRQARVAHEIAPADLQRLQRNEAQARELRIRQEAVATRIRFTLDANARVTLDGQPLSGQGEQRLLKAGELSIAGVGRIGIEPGGGDLAALAAELAKLETDQAALLARWNLADVPQALARHERFRAAEHDLKRTQALLEQLAPQGLDALSTELADLSARIDGLLAQQRLTDGVEPGAETPPAAQTGLAFSQTPPETLSQRPGPVSVAEAEQSVQSTGAELRLAQASAQAAQASFLAARATLAHAQAELQASRQTLQHPDRQQRVDDNRNELQRTAEQRERLLGAVAQREAQLHAAQPALIRQDVERLARSAQQALALQTRRRDELITLQARLEEAGAQGLDDTLADALAQAERLDRRHAELSLRARALDLLATLLDNKRHALTQRLQEPLQKHLDRYLQLLFPQASLVIDDKLSPGALTRARPGHASETGDFQSLSFGSREQLALISRLAYADLLKEAGRPTLIILDDALVHSDMARLSRMKRILFDAATRHQVLLFTCHPDDWRDLGVAARSIDSLRLASAPRAP